MNKLLIFGTLIVFVSCNNSNKNNTSVETDSTQIVRKSTIEAAKNLTVDEKEFLGIYQSFTSAIQNKNTDGFNKFIDPTFGFYIIESNGSMPSFVLQYEISRFKSIQSKSFFELNLNHIHEQPVFDSLPQIICDATPYNKEGCFVQKINPLINDEFWYVTNLNEKEKQAISALSEKIDYTVINTFHAKFYFAKIGNTWKIAMIDLRTPCEA